MVFGNDFVMTTETIGMRGSGGVGKCLRIRCPGLLIRLNLDSVTYL